MSQKTKPIPPFAQYGIAVFHNIGDILLCTPIARQLKASDPSCYITWYTSERYGFILENNPYIDEIVALPSDDPIALDSSISQLREERAWTRFLTPAPYMNYYTSDPIIVEAGVTLLDLVREAACLKWTVPYIPVVELTNAEVEKARAYWNSLPIDGPMILVETESNSNQTIWEPDFAYEMIEALKYLTPVFVFTSKNRPPYLDELLSRYEGIFWCDLPFRLNAELFNLCDGFVGVSSGISTLTYSTWCRDDIPRIEVTKGLHWSGFQHLKTRLLLVCHSRPDFSVALKLLNQRLSELRLNRISEALPLDFSTETTSRDRMQVTESVASDLNSAGIISVAFDISVLGLGHYHARARTGIYRFVDNLLNELVERSDISLRLVAHSNLLDASKEFVLSRPNLNARYEVQDLSSVIAEELLHSPFYPLPTSSIQGPRVLTIHDLIPIKFPHLFEYAEGDTLRNTIASLGNDGFVTVNSEATKADLCEFASHIDPNRIIVTPLAADPRIFYPCLDPEEKKRVVEKYNLGSTSYYILSVATLEPRKNIAHLIRAFVRLLREDGMTDLTLALVGTKGWKFEEIFAELSLAEKIRDRIVLTEFVPDEDMAALYSNAAAFVYPSLYEGFGLPPLEAMQCGTPVITSDNSSLPEVVGDAGILLPALDEDALVAAIRSLYNNSQMRQDLSQRGIVRSASFTWTRCAEQTVATYKKAFDHWREKFATPDVAARPIIIDAVFFQLYQTGIARVWRSLLREWAGTDFGKQLVVLDRGRTAPRFEGINYIDVPRYDYAETDGDRAMLQRICDEKNATLFISSYYTTPLTTPSVFMAHDMIPELLGADVSGNPMWREKHIGIRHASRFLAVSQNTANDLRRFFPEISTDHITVTHNGVDFKAPDSTAIAAFLKANGIERPYFLFVGARDGYKNGILFFQAFASLGDERANYAIVCTGPIVQLEPEYAAYVGGADVHMLKLSDDDLQAAYAAALALIYPSLYEGFGMPVVEAMACGCPVITTRRGSLPEVAGDAALYLDTEDIDSMARALEEVQDSSVRDRLVASGLKRAAEFSWSKMANEVCLALERTIAELAGQQTTLLSPGTDPRTARTPLEQALGLAMRHHQAGQLAQAESIYRQILVKIPGNFPALHMLGVVRFQRGDLAMAKDILQRAVAINSLTPEVHYNLGNVYAAQGHADEARECYKQALIQNKDFVLARQQLATLDETA